MSEKTYKRCFYRIKPSKPLCADVSISRAGGRETVSRSKEIRVLDISPGGLRFQSDLNFPLFADMALRFNIFTDYGAVSFEGLLIHKACVQNVFYYGVSFLRTERDSFNLLKLFNGTRLRLYRHFIILRF